MRSLATGVTDDGDRWDLQVGAGRPDPDGVLPGPAVMLSITSISGEQVVGGGSEAFVLDGRPIALAMGVGDRGPRYWLVLAAPEVSTLWATLSSRSMKRIPLHAAPELGELRVGVLLFDRRLDVHRLDAFDSSGNPIPDLPVWE